MVAPRKLEAHGKTARVKCVKCPRNHSTGKKRCPRCLKKAKERHRRNRDKIIADKKAAYAVVRDAGLCVICKRADADDGIRCTPCVELKKKQDKGRIEARKASGICTHCGSRPAAAGMIQCFTCCLRRRRNGTHYCRCGNERSWSEPACALCLTVCTKPRVVPLVIGAMRANPMSSVYDLAEASGASVRNVLRIVKRLAEMQAIRRVIDEDDATARYRLLEAA